MPLSALLFDLDGTLADSDPLHFRAFQTAAQRWGVEIDEDYFATRMSGRSNGAICAELLPRHGADDHAKLAAEKEELFRSTVDRVEPVAGLHPFLDWARGQGLKLAVVSNAPRANITAILDAFNIAGRFDAVVSGEELTHGKPDPLPYATALAQLGVGADQAIAFEDAVPGLTAAVRAGIPTVGVLTGHASDRLMQAGAALTVHDFNDPALVAFLSGRR